VVVLREAGRSRLMAVEQGKDPVPVVATTEENAAPMAPVGVHEIAFVIGPAPHSSIAVANTSTGRIVYRFSPDKGEIESLAASPDGGTIYFSARNNIWSIPVSGGEARMICAGHYVISDPSGDTLLISLTVGSRLKLLQVPLRGGAEREISTDGSFPMF